MRILCDFQTLCQIWAQSSVFRSTRKEKKHYIHTYAKIDAQFAKTSLATILFFKEKNKNEAQSVPHFCFNFNILWR